MIIKNPKGMSWIQCWANFDALALPQVSSFVKLYGDPELEEAIPKLIKLPEDNDMRCLWAFTRRSGDDVMWFSFTRHTSMDFWMLPNDQNGGYSRTMTIPKTEWAKTHTLNFEQVSREISMRRTIGVRVTGDECDDAEVHGSSLVQMIPGNPLVVVLKVRRMVCLYNLETMSVDSVLYQPDDFCHWFPYTEPLSLSSYAISAQTYK